MSVRPGQIIGDYRLLDIIGAGGMGEVYRAEHVRLGRTAVVKILKHLDAGGSAWQRFFNEARIQAELNHPNIAVLYAYYDSGVTPCIIMEYVDGATLGEILGRQGKLSPATALAYFTTIVATVRYIHERGIIHRDIKPNNIKITSRGQVKLLDFGISKASFSQDLTSAGKCIGTDHYLAPEQLTGRPASVASDIWALGALLYEMVTGQKAFEAGTWGELYTAIRTAAYTPPSVFAPELPPDLERVIATCLKKSPAQRYRDAAELERALLACATGPAGGTSGARTDWHLPRPLRSGRWLSSGAAAAALMLAGWGAYALFTGPPLPEPAPVPVTAPAGATASVAEPTRRAVGTVAETAALRTVRVNAVGNPARLYLGPDKRRLGGPYQTPYRTRYPKGTHLYFELHRRGYQTCRGAFTVRESSEANQYMYQLCKVGESCPASGCK